MADMGQIALSVPYPLMQFDGPQDIIVVRVRAVKRGKRAVKHDVRRLPVLEKQQGLGGKSPGIAEPGKADML